MIFFTRRPTKPRRAGYPAGTLSSTHSGPLVLCAFFGIALNFILSIPKNVDHECTLYWLALR
jgi:hypothetical protein